MSTNTTNFNFHATQDALEIVRKLPKDILDAFSKITIDRLGNDPDAYMRTENYLGYIGKDIHYRLYPNHIEPTDDAVTPIPNPEVPKYSVLEGEWISAISSENDDANILGGNGKFILPKGVQTVEVPKQDATPELLAYYGCQMVKFGEVFKSTADENLPLTVVGIGKTYEEGYLMNPQHGAGAYLEVHDRPHFHMPLNEQAGGHLIIGAEIDGERRLSGFKIPYGYGILMAPYCIHSDAYLEGRYIVVYSKTEHFSCVIVNDSNHQWAKINFV